MILSACIFDLNGTVLKDEKVYAESFRRVLKKRGVEVVSPYPHELGIGVKENWDKFIVKYKFSTPMDALKLSIETQNEYLNMLDEVSVTTGFEDFASEVKDAGIQTALATSNTWEIVDRVLAKFGLEKYFDVTTSGEEVLRKKPDPELFLLTSDKLSVSRHKCLVFEDSKSGITAAKAAGMKVIGVATEEDKQDEVAGANKIVTNFLELNVDLISKV